MPVVFLACKIFENILKGQNGTSTIYLDYGLHSVPKKLREAVLEEINAITEPSTIVLGYGLCGSGLHGIDAGIHKLVIPKADDCVAFFMGSRKKYLKKFRENPGTYYLTKGWFEVGSDPLSEYETLLEKYDLETADWLMNTQFHNYSKLVFVAQNQMDLDQYQPRAKKVAAYTERFGMEYSEYLGNDEFMKKIENVLNFQESISSEFIVVNPGETLLRKMFL